VAHARSFAPLTLIPAALFATTSAIGAVVGIAAIVAKRFWFYFHMAFLSCTTVENRYSHKLYLFCFRRHFRSIFITIIGNGQMYRVRFLRS
jgi:hypothetical protein